MRRRPARMSFSERRSASVSGERSSFSCTLNDDAYTSRMARPASRASAVTSRRSWWGSPVISAPENGALYHRRVQVSAYPPNWPSIDTVLLDMDGTLLDLGYDVQFWEDQLPRRFAESRGITVEEAERQMRPIFESTAGTLDWYCVEYWSRALSYDVVALKRATRHRIDWLPDAPAFLARLRAAGKRLALVTNAHPEILA